MMKICFVCTGNTCRSPMAAAVLNHWGKKRGLCAQSAGLYPHEGEPISERALRALERAGVPVRGAAVEMHTAHCIEAAVFAECERVIGMTEAHADALRTAFPEFAAKIFAMPRPISDPWGGTQEVYDRCLAEIADGIREVFFQ